MAEAKLSKLIQDLLNAREELRQLGPTAHPALLAALEACLAQAQNEIDAWAMNHWDAPRNQGEPDANRHE